MSEEYLVFSSNETVEFIGENYWVRVKSLLLKTLKVIKLEKYKLRGIGISSHSDSLFCVSKRGELIRQAISWLDNRSSLEGKLIEETFGKDYIYEYSGQPEVYPFDFFCRILWLKRNEVESFNRTFKFLQPLDFIIYKLTGSFTGSYSLFSSSLLLDINNKKWKKATLDLLGIDQSNLPELYDTTDFVGFLKSELLSELGLNEKIPVITGGMDQICAAVGCGNINFNKISETTGTVLAILANTRDFVINKTARIPCFIGITKNQYCLLPWSSTGGILLKWFRDNFFSENNSSKNKDISYELMSKMAKQKPAGSQGLLTLPYIDGAISPHLNPEACGIFFGIRTYHDKGYFVRSCMESISYILNYYLMNIEDYSKSKIKEIISIGGGSKSEIWNQIKSDICGKPVLTLEEENASVLGAAIFASVGCGYYKNIQEAITNMVRKKDRFIPDCKNHEIYKNYYKKFLMLYDYNKELFTFMIPK